MEFIDVTGDIHDSYTSLDRVYIPLVQKKRKPWRILEDDAKIELWKSFAASLKPQDNVNTKSELIECTILFQKVVADFALQYDPKDWCYLKKKVMDVFYDYKQRKSNSHSTYPNNPPYLANQFIQENNFQLAHFMNMVSNVPNNWMPINLLTRKLQQPKIMSFICFHPFLRVQMILIDILNTTFKRNIVMDSYIAL